MAGPKKPVSHDAGGPSASRGPAYQTYFAVYQTLELIVRHFAAPHKTLAIRIEPRIVHRESGSVTAWGVLIEADAIAWEAKLDVINGAYSSGTTLVAVACPQPVARFSVSDFIRVIMRERHPVIGITDGVVPSSNCQSELILMAI